MARLRRCDELVTEFRMRIGEPEPGTFDTIHYDGINENVHEIRAILNQAQDHVAWICYSANQTLLEDTVYFDVLSGVTRYMLPEDFLGPVSVYHRTAGQEYKVDPENLSEIRRSTRSPATNHYYQFYEIREKVPFVAARGIIDHDSPNRLQDYGLESVRVGDTCYNLTDGSEGVIDAVFPSTRLVQVDALSNGSTNRFQRGDVYQIDMAEKTQDAMDFWPQVTKDQTKTIYNGLPVDWRLNENAVLVRLNLDFSQPPSNLEPDERIVAQLIAGDVPIAEASRVGLEPGPNEFVFPDLVQLFEDVPYTVRVTRIDTNRSLNVDGVEVIVRTAPESLEIKYARLPRQMSSLKDYCEMPSWSLNAVHAYGHIIAQKKASGNPNADPGLVAEFKDEIRNIEKFQYKRDERDIHSIMPGYNTIVYSPFPLNYGYAVVDPFDLF